MLPSLEECVRLNFSPFIRFALELFLLRSASNGMEYWITLDAHRFSLTLEILHHNKHTLSLLPAASCVLHQRPFPEQRSDSLDLLLFGYVHGHSLFFAIDFIRHFFLSHWIAVPCFSRQKKEAMNGEHWHGVDTATRLLFRLHCIPYALHDARHVSIDTFHERVFSCCCPSSVSVHHSFHRKASLHIKLNWWDGAQFSTCISSFWWWLQSKWQIRFWPDLIWLK